MGRWSFFVGGVLGVGLAAIGSGFVSGCSSTATPNGFGNPGGGSGGSSGGSTGSSSGSGSSGDDGGIGSFGGDGGPVNPISADGGTVCPSGLQCNVSCPSGQTTSITGKVFDPAGKNVLYNAAVYVPAVPLVALPRGVPTGSEACDCAALFKSGAVVTTTTAVDGTFTLKNVPVGTNVPIVIQIGKWRHMTYVKTAACANTAVPDPTLSFPSSVPAGDINDSMPDIAVSTGEADTLECLMRRMGLPDSEYVAGSSTAGHVHMFAGGGTGGGSSGGFGGGAGRPETPGFSGAPASPANLWSSQAQLMPYDIVLLSCEGGETYDANPAAMEAYLNAGGRAFASHFHYAWFSGPLSSGQSYSAPSDWGSNLATWSSDNGQASGPIDGTVVQTLNGSTQPFPKGVALQQWLGNVGALGQNGVPAADLSIYQPRYNAVVGPSNKPSQPWITSPNGSTTQTMYFSFDTPVGGTPNPDGGAPSYCGRAVFSDLHVSGNPSDTDGKNPPSGCDDTDLSPQEKALEFMLFDLSSCVIPDTIAPPDAGVPIAN